MRLAQVLLRSTTTADEMIASRELSLTAVISLVELLSAVKVSAERRAARAAEGKS